MCGCGDGDGDGAALVVSCWVVVAGVAECPATCTQHTRAQVRQGRAGCGGEGGRASSACSSASEDATCTDTSAVLWFPFLYFFPLQLESS